MKSPHHTISTEVLRRLGTLSRFGAKEIEKLSDALTVREFKRRQRIFDRGDSADLAYLLLSGIVRISLVNQEGKQVLVTLLSPGALFWACVFPL